MKSFPRQLVMEICRVMFGALFVEGGDICFFPKGREGGGVKYVIEELGEEWQAYGARTLEHFIL